MSKAAIVPQVRYAVERLRMLRELFGLKVDQLGLEGTKSYWSDFENLRNEPRMSTIVRYCDALDIPFDVLMFGCPESDGTSRIPSKAELSKTARVLFGLKPHHLEVIDSRPAGWERIWLAICVAQNMPALKDSLGELLKKTIEVFVLAVDAREALRERAAKRLGLESVAAYCFTLGTAGFVFNDKESALEQVEKLKKVKSFASGAKPLPKVSKVKNVGSWVKRLSGVSRVIANGHSYELENFLAGVEAAFGEK